MKPEKVLILYDFINHKIGGGELLLSEVLKLYPNADLLSLMVNKNTLKAIDSQPNRFFYKNIFYYWPNFIKKNPFFILPFISSEIKRWSKIGKEYDKVIAVSSAWCHNYTPSREQQFYRYLFSPPRMIWDQQGEYLEVMANRNTITKTLLKFPITRLWVNYLRYKLRLWDFYHNYKADNLASISKTVHKRIGKYYYAQGPIIYPFLHVGLGQSNQSSLKNNSELSFLKDHKFFLSVSVLADYKHIDFIIKSFIKSKISAHLVIAGVGPMQNKLKVLAKKSKQIIFLGYIDNQQKEWLLKHCQAFLFAAKEDFGMAPLEANCFGRPIIAGDKGSMKELVTNGYNGQLYQYGNLDDLAHKLQIFHTHTWDENNIIDNVKHYNIESFRHHFLKFSEKGINLKTSQNH